MYSSFCVLILFTTITAYVAADFGLKVTVNDDGSYVVAYASKIILESAPPFFVVDGTRYTGPNLILQNVTEDSGTDGRLGGWKSFDISYLAGHTQIVASARNYDYGVVIFSVEYVNGATGTSVSDYNQLICGFPGFKVGGPRDDLGYLAFGGHFTGNTDKSMGRWDSSAVISGGLEGSGPLAVFDRTGNTVVITPLDNFMITSMWHDTTNGYVYWGMMGGLDQLPISFKYQTIINYNTGINAAMESWGLVVADMYYNQTKSVHTADHDVTTKYLGYWTDDGSYYAKGPEPGKDYAQTIVALQWEGIDKTKLPYKYFQLDSWWCVKNGTKVKNWIADPTALPQGVSELHNITDLSFMLYSGVWSGDNVYAAANGGKYGFVIEGDTALPLDQAFWDDLFATASQWGLVTYEQDGMDETFMAMNVTRTDPAIGKTWLRQMNDAAVRNNISILYSDAYPRHIYQSIELPAVTQARVSADYGKNPDQWKIGISSIFADAVSLIPNKDSFRTSHNASDFKEPYPELEQVVALLSRGPVGNGDPIGLVNGTILHMCCGGDGRLLQPMHPAKAIDAQILEAAFEDGKGPDGEIWSTFTEISASGFSNAKFGIIFAAGLTKPFDITPQNTHLDHDFSKSKIYRWNYPTQLFDFSIGDKFTLTNCTLDNFCLYYTSPVLQFQGMEIVILGEVDKWVHMPYERISQITLTDMPSIEMTINAAPHEHMEIWVMMDGQLGAFAVRADDTGNGLFVFEKKHVYGGSDSINSSSLKLLFSLIVLYFVL